MLSEGSNLSLADVVTSTAMPNLQVLARGGDGRHWRAQSRPLERLLAQARGSFDLIVIDAPALLDDPAAMILAKQAGHVLLVVRKAGLTSTELATAVEDLRRSGAEILGCVMTSRRRRPAPV
jgi:Mrp family chromosome partitioning ATPase